MIKKTLDLFEKALKLLACTCFCGFVALTILQVFTRYLFSHSITWTEQISRYLFIWMIMLCIPIIVRQNEDLSFDVIFNKLPLKVRNVLTLVMESCIMLFAAYWCYWGLQICIKFVGKYFTGVRLAKNFAYSAQPIGAFFLFLFALEVLIGQIRKLRGEATK